MTETEISLTALNPKNGTCSFYTGFMFQDERGTRHSLGMANVPTTAPACAGRSAHLSGGDQIITSMIHGGPIVATPAGTVYTFGGTPCSGGAGDPAGLLPESVEDTNGNIVQFSGYTTGLNCSGAITETDTLGRTVLSASGFGSTGNTVTVSGLSAPYTLTWGSVSPTDPNLNSEQTTSGQSLCALAFSTTGPSGSYNVVTALELPNGKEYTFSYDSASGLLDKITYPSGGYVSYTWGSNVQSEEGLFQNSSGELACSYYYDTPAVSHRYVSYDGVHIAEQQDFAYSTSWGAAGSLTWSTKTTTVTTHDLVRGNSFQTVYTYSSTTPPTPPYYNYRLAAQVTVEQGIVYYDVNGNTLKTENETWDNMFEMASKQIVWGNGQSSMETYQYGSGGTVTQKEEYDYGASNPTRITVNNYQPFPSTSLFPSGSAYIFNRPCQTIVYDSTGTNKVAETDMLYDGGQAVCGTAGTPSTIGVSGLPPGTHDETNYSSSSSTPRGNVTSTIKLCIQASPVCSFSNQITSYSYDETGQVLTFTEPCGNQTCTDMTDANHTTTYSYLDNYSSGTPSGDTNAYVTKLTKPPTSGVAHITKYSYALADGQLTESVDENNQPTYYSYVDSLDRLTLVTYADGGETSYSYNDSAPSPTVTTTERMTSSQNFTTIKTFDGFGHVTQTEVSSLSTPIYTTNSYDGLGRVYTTSNPHYTSSSPTDGTATFTYDALGRAKSISDTDGSSSTISYSGNTVTATDEAAVTRQRQTDALGRLTVVTEDPNGLDYSTSYSYDLLDHLTGVFQSSSRTRTFVFNSLSQLASATNPESGTVSYAHDANGNAQTRTDARTIVSTYLYDALNRIKQKSYSDGTATAAFIYDASSWQGLALLNTVGRLAYETTTNAGSIHFSDGFSYDPVGRVANNAQCITPSCSGGPSSVTYAYDQIGDVTQYANGVGVTFSQAFDAGARLTRITSNLVDAQHPSTIATVAQYLPPGHVQEITLGNGLTETSELNTRLQPCRFNINSAGVDLHTCTDALPSGNLQDFSYAYNLGSTDNGNVTGVTATGVQTINRAFAYDSLNRLKSMTGTGGSCTGLSWSYDTWGNRLTQTPTGGSCISSQLTYLASNQISGYTYDNAGNLVNDTVHTYSYDAENRLIAVDSGSTATYAYSADGQRVQRVASGVTTSYLRNRSGAVIAETTAVCSPACGSAEYIYLNSELIGEYINGTTYFVEADSLGSTSILTGMAGQAADCNAFYPFGEVDSSICSSSNVTTHKFSGKERDSETNLDNFEARFFASRIGRFMSPDPRPVTSILLQNPQDLNPYVYTIDSPERYFDPNGKDWREIAGKIADALESMAVRYGAGLGGNLKFGDSKDPKASGFKIVAQGSVTLNLKATPESTKLSISAGAEISAEGHGVKYGAKTPEIEGTLLTVRDLHSLPTGGEKPTTTPGELFTGTEKGTLSASKGEITVGTGGGVGEFAAGEATFDGPKLNNLMGEAANALFPGPAPPAPPGPPPPPICPPTDGPCEPGIANNQGDSGVHQANPK